MLDPVVHVHRAVAAFFPAVPGTVAKAVGAAATDGVGGLDDACLKRGGGDHHLERGARRIDAAMRARIERRHRVVAQFGIILAGYSVHERVRVEGRGRDHRQHVAGGHIHQHGGAAFTLKPLDRHALQLGINGDEQVLARHGGVGGVLLQLLHRAAMRVGHNAAAPRAASQPVLGKPLHALPADADVRVAEQFLECLQFVRRAALGQPRQVVGAGARHIAEHVRKIPAARIRPRRGHLHIDAVHLHGAHAQARKLLIAQFLHHGDRHETRAADPVGLDFLEHAFDARFRKVDELRELQERRFGIVQPLRHNRDAASLALRRERAAETVQDLPPLRRRQHQADMVFVGELAVMLGLEELQLRQASHQCGKHRAASPHRQQQAAVKVSLRTILACHQLPPGDSPGRRPRSNIPLPNA